MSWAARNPERFSKICAAGIAAKFYKLLTESGWDNLDRDQLLNLATTLESETELSGQLCAWAHQEISDAESSYLSGLAD